MHNFLNFRKWFSEQNISVEFFSPFLFLDIGGFQFSRLTAYEIEEVLMAEGAIGIPTENTSAQVLVFLDEWMSATKNWKIARDHRLDTFLEIFFWREKECFVKEKSVRINYLKCLTLFTIILHSISVSYRDSTLKTHISS